MRVHVKIKWVEKTGQYQNGKYAMVNRICVGSVDWNGGISRTAPEEQRLAHQYIGTIRLPSIKNKVVYGDTEVACQDAVQKVVDDWTTEYTK